MLQSLGLVAGQRDEALQALALLAANLASAPIGLVCLIESDHIFVVGAAGFEASLIDRHDSFCSHAILEPAGALWIADAGIDQRFLTSRYVLGQPYARFYAGVPLKVNGEMVGTLCVLGPEPRPYESDLISKLTLVAGACEAELAERHRTAALRHALAASADALVDCDPQGLVTAWSSGAERLFGFSAEEAIGREITLIIPDEYRDAHRRGMRRWRASGAARLGSRLELPATSRDGASLDIELWMSVSHDHGKTRVHANIRDISERRTQAREAARNEAQARDLEVQLHHVWRLNSLGEMAASLAHELNQPLTAATTYLHAAKTGLEKGGLVPSSAVLPLDLVKAQLLRAGSIISRMRELVADESPGLQPERVGEMLADLQSLLRLIETDMGVTIEIDVDLEADHVLADRVQFQQAIVNLVRNAAEATRNRSGGRAVVVGRVRSGTAFELRIEDNGPGLDPQELEQAFRPLSTSKTSGMGLGLSVTKAIIERHEGTLSVERSSMGGAAFIFDLTRQFVDR